MAMSGASFCGQTELMQRVSGGVPGMLGSYANCPATNGTQFCVLFPTTPVWGDSRLLGYCLPAACSLQHIAAHVNADPYLNGTFRFGEMGTNAAQLAQFILCAPRNTPYVRIGAGNIVAWTVLGLIAAVVLCATFYDYYHQLTHRSVPFEVARMATDGSVTHVLQHPRSTAAEAAMIPVSLPFLLDSSRPLLEAEEAFMPSSTALHGEESSSTAPNPMGATTRTRIMSFPSKSLRGKRRRGLSVFRRRHETGDAFLSHRRMRQFLNELPEPPDFLSIVSRIVMCLSLINSFRKFRYYPKSEASLNLFNSWRVMAWGWVMLFCTFWYAQQVPSVENIGLRNVNLLYAFVEKESLAAFAIGSFLVIAGFLALHRLHTSEAAAMVSPTARVRAAQRTRGQRIRQCALWYAKYLFARFVRVTPINLAIVTLVPNALSSAGDGPFWQIFAQSPVMHENCGDNWWTNFLLVNNIFPRDEEARCFPWSYYVALEFQLVAVAPLIYFIGKQLHHRLFTALLVMAMGTSAGLRYVELTTRGAIHFGRSTASPYSLRIGTVHQYPHLMFIPFCAGAMLYYLYRAVRQRAETLRMFGPDLLIVMNRIADSIPAEDRASYWLLNQLRSQRVRIVFIWGGLVLLIGCIMSAWCVHRGAMHDEGGVVGVGVRVYESLILFPWCAGLCLTALPLLFGYGGMFRRVLIHRIWCGPSRLVLVAYLVAPVIVGFGNANSYELVTLHFLLFMVQWLGYVLATLLVAFVLHMLIERPCLYASSRGEY